MTAYTEKCSQSIAAHPAGLIEILTHAFCQWMITQRLKFRLAQERHQLLEMSVEQLKDIGVDREAALDEARRTDIPRGRFS